jgi:HD-GYP domain-containing protein (c-di-GMP phosphodiesterase class II)
VNIPWGERWLKLNLNYLLGPATALTLLICAFYAYAFAFLAPYSGLTFDEQWNIIQIDECDARAEWCRANQAGLQVGDKLLSIGNLTFEGYRADRRRVPFEGYETGDTVPITRLRQGVPHPIAWRMPSHNTFIRLRQMGAVIFFLPFWLAGTLVWLFLQPRDERWVLLILFNFITALWLAAGAQTALHVADASLVSRAITWLMAPIFLHLHFVVPAPLRRPASRSSLLAAYVGATALAALEFAQLLPPQAFYLGLLVAILSGLSLLLLRLIAPHSSPRDRLTAGLMLTGIGLSFGPGLILGVVPQLLGANPPSLLTIGLTGLAVPMLPVFYTYAIYKRRLGALEFRANRLLGLYSFFLIYLTAFALVYLLTRTWIGQSTDNAATDLILSGLFIIAIPPLSARFQRLVDRLAYGVVYNPDELIYLLSSRLPTAPNREALVSLLTDEMLPNLFIRQSALYLFEGGDVQRVYARGVALDWALATAANQWLDPIFPEAGQYRPPRPEVSDESPADQPTPGAGAEALEWVRLALFLETQEKPVGIWLFGRRDPDDYYPQSDIKLLKTLANQVALAMENARLFAEASRRLERLQTLRSNDLTIMASLDLRVTLNAFLEQITVRLDVDAAAILLLNESVQLLTFAAGRGFRTRALQHTQLRLGESHAGQAALERRVVVVPNLREAAGDLKRAPLLASEGFVAYYGTPLITKGHVAGVLEIFHRSPLKPDAEWMEFLETLAGQAAIAIDNAKLFEGLQRSNVELALAYDTTLEGWSRALELRDQETEGHTERVTEMTLRLARAVGRFAEAELMHLRRGALLHDIGKMGIPDGILLKPGPLTEAEWEIMRQHPIYAHEMLSPIAFLRPALDIPYCHHEKWDGSGYPRGLRGEQIPLAARVFAVADVWDALRSNRPYRAAWPEAQVIAHIRSLSGVHFDPQIVEAFLKVLGEKNSPA